MYSAERSESKSSESLVMQSDEDDFGEIVSTNQFSGHSDTVSSGEFVYNGRSNQETSSPIGIYDTTDLQGVKYQIEQLTYTIYSYSSHLQNYVPSNILEHRPSDPASRWTSASVDPPQFIILKLQSPVILRQITFGKYEKAHACNMKRFKIYSGMTEGAINHEILDGTLRNDTSSETFNLKCTVDGQTFASRFIKIVPIVSWGGAFNYTVWHVALHGVAEASIVSSAIKHFDLCRKKRAVKLCLKFLRQANYPNAFSSLAREANLPFEDEVLTKLHKYLVKEGDCDMVEQLLDHCFDRGYFDDHLSQQSYQAVWTLVEANGGKEQRPGMRGGHQMAIDPVEQRIYLFGGWNGKLDLSDFWVFDVRSNQWTCLSPDTSLVGGPSPRSCHKMVLDHMHKKIYLLGRYLDSGSRTVENLKSDFYVYDIESDHWSLICDDTSAVGGPKLIFDHQLAIDTRSNKLYVFGGRVILPSTMPSDSSSTSISPPLVSPIVTEAGHFTYESTVGATSSSPTSLSPSDLLPTIDSFSRPFKPERVNFSGMYSYDIESNRWKCLRNDSLIATTTQSLIFSDQSKAGSLFRSTIRSRVGHSMVLHEEHGKLYIFAGQCNNEYMADFVEYNLTTDEVAIRTNAPTNKVAFNSLESPIGKRDFTQRATIDEELNEIYVFSGITNDNTSNSQSSTSSGPSAKLGDISKVKNSFWVYNLVRGTWNCVYRNEYSSGGENGVCPCPRYAHSLVYDKINRIHYLFGGNPGSGEKSPSSSHLRLDDFWSLKLIRPSPTALKAKLLQLLRQVSNYSFAFFLDT